MMGCHSCIYTAVVAFQWKPYCFQLASLWLAICASESMH